MWEPTQEIDWLGLRWTSNAGTLSIIEQRMEKLKATLQSIIRSGYAISSGSLAKCVEQIISTGPVFRNVSRIINGSNGIDTMMASHTYAWLTQAFFSHPAVHIVYHGFITSFKESIKENRQKMRNWQKFGKNQTILKL